MILTYHTRLVLTQEREHILQEYVALLSYLFLRLYGHFFIRNQLAAFFSGSNSYSCSWTALTMEAKFYTESGSEVGFQL